MLPVALLLHRRATNTYLGRHINPSRNWNLTTIKFYYHHTPNPKKVALFLEEAGLAYETHSVDVFKSDQHSNWYRAINPNGKVPALEDGGTRVFGSNAILLYLAEKTSKFLGAPEDKAERYSWLMWVATGLDPYSGQWVHFQAAGSAEDGDYAKRRHTFEAHRHHEVLDQHLAGRDYIVGKNDTIADIAPWGQTSSSKRTLIRKRQKPCSRRTSQKPEKSVFGITVLSDLGMG